MESSCSSWRQALWYNGAATAVRACFRCLELRVAKLHDARIGVDRGPPPRHVRQASSLIPQTKATRGWSGFYN